MNAAQRRTAQLTTDADTAYAAATVTANAAADRTDARIGAAIARDRAASAALFDEARADMADAHRILSGS